MKENNLDIDEVFCKDVEDYNVIDNLNITLTNNDNHDTSRDKSYMEQQDDDEFLFLLTQLNV